MIGKLTKYPLFVAIATFCTLALAGCGGGGNSTPTTTPIQTGPPSPAPTPPSQPAPAITAQMTVVQYADGTGTHYQDSKVQIEPTSSISGYLRKRDGIPVIGLEDSAKFDFSVFPVVIPYDAYIIPVIDSVSHTVSLSLVNAAGATLSGSKSPEVTATLIEGQASITVIGSPTIMATLDVSTISRALGALPTYQTMSPDGRKEEIDAMARCLVAYLT